MRNSQLVILATEVQSKPSILHEQVCGAPATCVVAAISVFCYPVTGPTLSWMSGLGQGTAGADKKRPVSWALGICQAEAQLGQLPVFSLSGGMKETH